LTLLTRTPVDGSYVADILPATVLLGIGAGLSFPALMMLAMSGATSSDSGLASGLVNTTLQVGGAVGLAVLATLSASRTRVLLAGGAGRGSALTVPPGVRHRCGLRDRRDRPRDRRAASGARRRSGRGA
ncbi:MAG: hypothetical protein M3O94_01070, partial [Actinomycetota bacterium]|nr:hypothetical protein [Actinomycetota bacterium]